MAIGAFRQHLGLKFVSIALATLLWMVVSGEQVVEQTMRVPLEFTNLPPQLEVLGDAPAMVDVRVRGSSGTLSRVPMGELVAVLDLRDARSGRRLFHLAGTDVRTPFGIEVVQVSPSTVSIAFDASAAKVVPVVPRVEGEPAAGFTVGVVTAEPSTVEVLGPVSVLKGLTEAITEPVSIAGASSMITESVTVGVTDAAARLRSPQRARVSVSVLPAPQQWAVASVPVKARNVQGTVEIMPAQVSVQVRGPSELSGTAASAFEATVDMEGRRPGRYQMPVTVSAPSGIAVTSVDPADVWVTVR